MSTSARSRSRKSFLGRLRVKPLIARLRGNQRRTRDHHSELQSPTSIADFPVTEDVAYHLHPDPPEDLYSREENERLHLEDYGTIFVKEIVEDGVSTFSQSSQNVPEPVNQQESSAFSLEDKIVSEDDSVGLNENEERLQRGFSYQVLESDTNIAQRTKLSDEMLKPGSPVKDNESSFNDRADPNYDDFGAAALTSPMAERGTLTETAACSQEFATQEDIQELVGLTTTHESPLHFSRSRTSHRNTAEESDTHYVEAEHQHSLPILSPTKPQVDLLKGVEESDLPHRVDTQNGIDISSTIQSVALDYPFALAQSSMHPKADTGTKKQTSIANDKNHIDSDEDNKNIQAISTVASASEKEATIVNIVKGKYRNKTATILRVLKNIEVRIEGENKTTWLPRSSLSYRGHTPFPPPEKENENSASKSRLRNNDGFKDKTLEKEGPPVSTLQPGARVAIIKGTYKGNYGRVMKVHKVRVTVKIDGLSGEDRTIGISSVETIAIGEFLATDEASRDSATIIPNIMTLDQISDDYHTSNAGCDGENKPAENIKGSRLFKSNDLYPGVKVTIRGGKYHKEGYRAGTVVKVNPVLVTVNIDGFNSGDPNKRIKKSFLSPFPPSDSDRDENVILISEDNTADWHSPSSGSSQSNRRLCEDIQVDDWRIVDSHKATTNWGERQLQKIRYVLPRSVISSKRGLESDALTYLFQSRLQIREIPLNDTEFRVPILHEFTENDSRYELVSAKVYADGDSSFSGAFHSPEKVVLVYCKVSGPGIQCINLRQELEKIADFGRLDRAKVSSRLELLQSPAYKFKSHPFNEFGIFSLDSVLFGSIEETGNEGCGFICERLLVNLLGGGSAAKRACAIQVRIFAPKFGVMKGVLCKSRIVSGPLILLPPSMVKVGPSYQNILNDKALLLITKNGVHPNSNNEMLGRLLSGRKTTKTFRMTLEKKKKLSPMILRLWQALGVNGKDCQEYAGASKKEDSLQHAFVLGLADPTAQLPPGTVFIPGLPSPPSEVFVTRSPCIEPSDGRMIAPVTNRPDGMSPENWDLLETFPFGCIIFSNPRKGKKPMPVLIGDGDLDGDLYFICWNLHILARIHALPLPKEDADEQSVSTRPYNSQWLAEGQERMVDVASNLLLGRLIGKLYNVAQDIADKSEDYMNDPRYAHFARAYKEALKIGKHGGKVYLPRELHEYIPVKYHRMLDTAEES